MAVVKGSKYPERRKPVYGWGINDADLQIWVKVDGKRVYDPVYSRWISIVQRSNDPKEKARKPHYKDVYADDRWKHLTDFQAWLYTQPYWEELVLDKDILFPGNNVYGPDTCVFVPIYINNLVLRRVTNSKYLRGVQMNSIGKYNGTSNLTGKSKSFKTEIEAHQFWQQEYAGYIEEKVSQYATEKWFNSHVADALLARAWKLRLDASLGVITTTI